MSQKEKTATTTRLAIRGGGLMFSFPILLALLLILTVLNIVMGTVIFGALFGIGGAGTVVAPVLPALLGVFILSMFAFFVLIRATVRYVGGIGMLWNRLRGIQEENKRIDRLIDHSVNAETKSDSGDINDDAETTQKQQYH